MGISLPTEYQSQLCNDKNSDFKTILITITSPGKHGRSLAGILRERKGEDAVCGSTFRAKNKTKSDD